MQALSTVPQHHGIRRRTSGLDLTFDVLFAFSIIALLIKDTVPIGDRYVLRGLSQGLCLVVGLYWLTTADAVRAMRLYAALFIYLFILLMTVAVARDSFGVLFQVVSFAAIILFGMAYMERSPDARLAYEFMFKIAFWSFFAVCAVSVVVLLIWPWYTFEYEFWSGHRRFRGVFSEPALMAGLSGFLLGIAMFFKNMRPRWRVAAGVVAAFCLALTQMRSGWAGFAVATLATVMVYWRHRALAIGSVVFLLLIGIQSAITLDPDAASEGASDSFRSDSIETLSGRLPLWEAALARFTERPVLGYGFMYGSDALIEDMAAMAASGDQSLRVFLNTETFTLHSGYVQSLLDSGALGAFLYLIVVITAVVAILRKDRARQFGALFYCLVFSLVFNLAETYIKGSGGAHSVFYWYNAIFALGVPVVHSTLPGRPNDR